MSLSLTAQQPTRIPLDDTGVADWRALNPVKPLELGEGELEIVNTTGDRTFVVTIPYVYPQAEFSSAYSIARRQHKEHSLANAVCRVVACTDANIRDLNALEQVKIVTERLATAKPSTKWPVPCFPATDTCNTGECTDRPNAVCRGGGDERGAFREDLTCQMERIFWSAACAARANADAIATYATRGVLPPDLEREVEHEARTTMSWIFNDPVAPPMCTAACARALFDSVEQKLCGGVRAAGCAAGERELQNLRPDMGVLTEQQTTEATMARFASMRFTLVTQAVAEAARDEAIGIFAGLGPLMTELETERTLLEQTIERASIDDERMIAQCQLRELTVAARLLSSYSADAAVPYEVPAWFYEDFCYRKEPKTKEAAFTVPSQRAVLIAQSAVAAQAERREAAIRRAERERLSGSAGGAPPSDIAILDCNRSATQVACVATATIPPNQRATFSQSILQHHPEARIRFTVAYFDDTEPPPNNAGYILRTGAGVREMATRSEFGFGFGADTTTGYDLPPGFQGHARHTTGGGAVTTQYRYEALEKGAVDVSATLRFKQGDFGGAASTGDVTATQYQARIAGPGGWIGQFGRMQFARPSAGIAISERGEGLRVARDWKNIGANLAYIIRRESDTPDQTPDASNDDSDVFLLQLTPRVPRLRNALLTVAYGEDKNNRRVEVERETEPDQPVTITQIPLPYWYTTFGSDIRVAVPYTNSVLMFAAYHSIRKVYAHAPLEPNQEFTTDRRDGDGTVALVTWSWTRNARRRLTDAPTKANPSFGTTIFLGHGTGDDPNTPDRNEGYVGENAGYANDLIFLSQIASNAQYAKVIGKGLANKLYAGAQYTDARHSLLEPLARAFGAGKGIESRSTVATLHTYWFDRAIGDRKYAGTELDVEFKLEAPKSVRWFFRGAFYRTSRAVESLGRGDTPIRPLLEKNPWLLAAGVTLSFEGR